MTRGTTRKCDYLGCQRPWVTQWLAEWAEPTAAYRDWHACREHKDQMRESLLAGGYSHGVKVVSLWESLDLL